MELERIFDTAKDRCHLARHLVLDQPFESPARTMTRHEKSWPKLLEIPHRLIHFLRGSIGQVETTYNRVDRATVDFFSVLGNIYQASVTAAREYNQTLP